jgi:hypothetical protein
MKRNRRRLSVEMRTHGLDWREKLHASASFVALVTPAWHADPWAQRQYAYAKTLGKPILLLVQQGTALPPDADTHTWRVWTTPEEVAALIQEFSNDTLHRRHRREGDPDAR